MHRKKTSVNALLHPSSDHQKRGIPTGKFLKARRICSQDDLFLKQAKDLSSCFRERCYRPGVISEGFRRAALTKRDDLLIPKKKNPADPQVRFISSNNIRWREIRAALKKQWKGWTPRLGNTLHYYNVHTIMRYRRSKNLKAHNYNQGTVPSRAFGSKGEKWGCDLCGNCVACLNIQRSMTFTSSDG